MKPFNVLSKFENRFVIRTVRFQVQLEADGFSDPAMLDWKFENDNGRSPQMHHAHRYVEQWQAMRSENLGLLLWGGVGTGKSFLAGCIANALMKQKVPVRMTNFARIRNLSS